MDDAKPVTAKEVAEALAFVVMETVIATVPDVGDRQSAALDKVANSLHDIATTLAQEGDRPTILSELAEILLNASI